jgi:DNA-binding transcriptional LysR family regulator
MVSAAERALALFDAASRRPSGPLAVTLPTELCAGWLPPLLRGFEAAHPEVRVTIHAGDEAVDLARGDHDVAIRAAWHLRPPTGGDAIDLLPLALVAAPSLARRFRRLDATAGSSLPLIGFTARAPVDRLEALGPDGAAVSVPAATPIRVNSGLLAAELAREGFGAALVLRRAVAADLASGRLAPVLVPLSFGVVAVRILMRDARPSAAARAFAGFLRAARPPKGR